MFFVPITCTCLRLSKLSCFLPKYTYASAYQNFHVFFPNTRMPPLINTWIFFFPNNNDSASVVFAISDSTASVWRIMAIHLGTLSSLQSSATVWVYRFPVALTLSATMPVSDRCRFRATASQFQEALQS